MRAKESAPASERKQPETFCWVLNRRRSRSAWWLVEGNRQGVEEGQNLLNRWNMGFAASRNKKSE